MDQTEVVFQRFHLPAKYCLLAVSALIWLGALAGLAFFCPPFLSDAPVLLFDDFEADLSSASDETNNPAPLTPWHYSGDHVVREPGAGFAGSTGIRLTALESDKPKMTWDLQNPRRFSFLEFRGKMRSENIVNGEKSWQAARFLVFFKDKEGKTNWNHPNVAGQLSGTSAWKEFSEVFQVPDYSLSGHVTVKNSSKSGSIWCDDIFLGPAHLNPRYVFFRNLLLGWGGLLALAFVLAFRAWRNGGWVVMLLVAAIIFGVMCSKTTIEIIAEDLHIGENWLETMGHLLVFSMFGSISLYLYIRRLGYDGRKSIFIRNVFALFACLAGFAAVTEFIQVLAIGRTPSLSDWLVDVSGILMGMLFIWLVPLFPKIRNKPVT